MTHSFKFKDYTVNIGDLASTFEVWLKNKAYTKVLILVDVNTKTVCLPVFLEKTKITNYSISQIEAGETCKTLETCEIIWQSMFEHSLDRKSLLINLGGGVIGDMGGFCAATYKRGIDFIQIPTSLLSMTDAAVGGKLGIDFHGIKNAVGVFKNPSAVFCDTDFLKTLSNRELISGFAEVIKHACIGDPILWKQLLKIHDLRKADWPIILKRSLAVKVKVVKKDPFEQNLRQILNFGHTIGHAVESYFLNSKNPLTHGEAIAMGMIAEQYLREGASEDLNGFCAFLRQYFPKTSLNEGIFIALWDLMQQDKKNNAGKVRMAMPKDSNYGMQILEPSFQEVCNALLFYNHKY
jgi:3-dehydroquinate synthase